MVIKKYRKDTPIKYILEQIQNPGRRKATPPTDGRSGALQQTWNLNMNEYKSIFLEL